MKGRFPLALSGHCSHRVPGGSGDIDRPFAAPAPRLPLFYAFQLEGACVLQRLLERQELLVLFSNCAGAQPVPIPLPLLPRACRLHLGRRACWAADLRSCTRHSFTFFSLRERACSRARTNGRKSFMFSSVPFSIKPRYPCQSNRARTTTAPVRAPNALLTSCPAHYGQGTHRLCSCTARPTTLCQRPRPPSISAGCRIEMCLRHGPQTLWGTIGSSSHQTRLRSGARRTGEEDDPEAVVGPRLVDASVMPVIPKRQRARDRAGHHPVRRRRAPVALPCHSIPSNAWSYSPIWPRMRQRHAFVPRPRLSFGDAQCTTAPEDVGATASV